MSHVDEPMEATIAEEEKLLDSGDKPRRRRQPETQFVAMDSPSVDETQDLGFFKVWLLISQLLGVISIALVSAWCGQYLGGFAWQWSPGLQFNYHPFFMILGLIFCYGDSLLVYRVFRNQTKKTLKLVHFGLHSLAFVFAIIALKAVFDSHNLPEKPIPNMYSLHSWIGLVTVILFAMQYFCGFVAFLFPGLTRIWRAKYIPLHVFFGLAIFVMVTATSLMGITEKLIFSQGDNYKNLAAISVIGNLLGSCVALYAIFVIYLVATPQFKRRPLPEEVQLQLEQQSPGN